MLQSVAFLYNDSIFFNNPSVNFVASSLYTREPRLPCPPCVKEGKGRIVKENQLINDKIKRDIRPRKLP